MSAKKPACCRSVKNSKEFPCAVENHAAWHGDKATGVARAEKLASFKPVKS